jgi:predicted nucleic-acid-binding protein
VLVLCSLDEYPFPQSRNYLCIQLWRFEMRSLNNSLKLMVSLLLVPLFIQTANSQTFQEKSETRKLAEIYSSTSPLEVMKHLDELADLLRKDLRARVWLLDYEGTVLPGAAIRLSFMIELYLTRKADLKDYLLTRAGARRQGESKVEVWYVPPGGIQPQLSGETAARDYGAAYEWDEQYYLLQSEKALLKGTEAETLDSNYYETSDANYFDNHNTFLDSFRSELVLPQAWRGRIVIYPKRGDPPGLPQRIADYERRYLLRKHFIEPSRISLEIGEPRERRKIELWIVPNTIPLLISEFVPTDAPTTDAELAHLVADLQALKGVQADGRIFVIAYTGQVLTGAQNIKREVTAQAVLEDIKQSLLQKYGVAPDHVVLIDGGKQKGCGVELWIVPPGAIEPLPKLAAP